MFAFWLITGCLFLVVIENVARSPFSTPDKKDYRLLLPGRGRLSARVFQQRVDHFTPTDNRKWKQTYLMKSDFYIKGGPVFLNLNGDRSQQRSENEAWKTYAEWYSAIMIELECRLFNHNQLTRNLSIEHLKYLSMQQSVADVGWFIVNINKRYKLPANTHWVVFGQDNTGSLAVWARYKYPHLVEGAITLNAHLYESPELLDVLHAVFDIVQTQGNECVVKLQQAFEEYDELLSSINGSLILTQKLRLCSPLDLNNQKDVLRLNERMFQKLLSIADIKGGALKTVCHSMMNTTPNLMALDKFVQETSPIKISWKFPDSGVCVDHTYNENIGHLVKEYWANTERLDMYLKCSELGAFPTLEGDDQFLKLHLPLSYYYQKCADVFGKNFTKEFIEEAVEHTKVEFGGENIPVSRVVYLVDEYSITRGLHKRCSRIHDSYVFVTNGTHPDHPVSSEVSDIIADWVVHQLPAE